MAYGELLETLRELSIPSPAGHVAPDDAREVAEAITEDESAAAAVAMGHDEAMMGDSTQVGPAVGRTVRRDSALVAVAFIAAGGAHRRPPPSLVVTPPTLSCHPLRAVATPPTP